MYYSNVGELTRLQPMIDAIKDGLSIHPVKLYKLKDPVERRNGGKFLYKIIDGRHRIVASLANGYSYVPALIHNNVN
jgi:hypothetical protein